MPPAPGARRLLPLACLVALHAGLSLPVNVSAPAALVRGAAGQAALLSVRYSSGGAETPVVKWRLRRDKAVTVAQAIGTDIIGTLRPGYRGRIRILENGSLLIGPLRLDDEGTYEVEVSSTDDSFTGEQSINLTVDEPVSQPQVRASSWSVLELSEGVTLTCVLARGTRARFAWLRGGRPLVGATDTGTDGSDGGDGGDSGDGSDGGRLRLGPGRRALTFARVLARDDGAYSCEAENAVSRARSAPARLTVYRRSSLYIILSTGGIFLLVTLVTVCACWKPSKRGRRGAEAPGCDGDFTEPDEEQLKREAEALARTEPGRGSPVALYILKDKARAGGCPTAPLRPTATAPQEPPEPDGDAGFPLPSGRSPGGAARGPPRRYPRSPAPARPPRSPPASPRGPRAAAPRPPRAPGGREEEGVEGSA